MSFIETVFLLYILQLAVTTTNKLYTWGASPQVLRLQAQAQKKARILQHQLAAEKLNKNNESVDATCNDDDNAQENNSEVTANHNTQSTRNSNVKLPKSPSFRGINVGMIEEAQTHLQPSLVDTSLVIGQIVQVICATIETRRLFNPPIPLPRLQISTGCHHSCLLTKDGSVYTWGRNLDGQIGNGSRREVTIPTPLSYNPAAGLAKVPPRTNGYRSNDNNSPDSDNAGTNGNKDTRREESNRAIKAVSLCCGCDYTVAMQPGR